MTLKYEELERFIEELKERYKTEIGDMVFEKEIGKRFGLSKYIVSNVKKNVDRFGLLKPEGSFWKFKKTEVEEKIEKLEKEFDKKELTDYDELIK
jgi:transposase